MTHQVGQIFDDCMIQLEFCAVPKKNMSFRDQIVSLEAFFDHPFFISLQRNVIVELL